jgi:hypothetical protein
MMRTLCIHRLYHIEVKGVKGENYVIKHYVMKEHWGVKV